ncbi:hypothetical protein AOQ84DRAFT_375592 [Glonium stellatum]|uniref:Uncharacterized protein n=1 Tax=Glonium stellatum TaxID=574774 RepID=A0A8E2JUI8_9PEZI|nr:hypothetical protein AOQ84DRAFT_375592 [Glonium stellatum]
MALTIALLLSEIKRIPKCLLYLKKLDYIPCLKGIFSVFKKNFYKRKVRYKYS